MKASHQKVDCQFCGKPAKLVTGRAIYVTRRDLYGKKFWLCTACWAYCGCHPGSDRPLGTLANEATRKARMKAHAAFDPLWKEGTMKRADAYAWLAGVLEIGGDVCHIGMFSVDQCLRTVEACKEMKI